MSTFLLRIDDVLRRGGWTTESAHTARALAWLVAYLVLFGLAYGGAMGTFRGFAGQQQWQIVAGQSFFSAVKVPLLLVVTFLISLPPFFVLNTLLGLRRDFAQAVRSLVATQAALAIILASFFPFTILWYVSVAHYQAAILFNALMFAVASFAAQWLLRGYYGPLIARDRRHRWLLRSWLAVYAFVGIQMGWVLRPFIGAPNSPLQFFREHAWGDRNAYVVVARLIWEVAGDWFGG